jgi:hypothetical protein
MIPMVNANNRPLNIPLIAFTLVLSILHYSSKTYWEPNHYSSREQWGLTAATVVFSPIAVIWARALWNTVMPRVTGWREITFWEAAGLLTIAYFL